MPAEYVRRQTLKNAERYITPELKKFEDEVLTSQARALKREKRLYDDLIGGLQHVSAELRITADALARLDTLQSLAQAAERYALVCPEFTDAPCIDIIDGRHPVVAVTGDHSFVPNSITLDDDHRMLIITGPNMGGKSTYMRQTALIVLLALCGSFVPAASARLGPIDRIFTRIGASDDLAGGRSTFMVEMSETAHILHNATDASLVLLDEIGRGTSTFDGLAIAWATAHELATRVRAFTLFATHYFELTAIPASLDSVANVHLDAVEHNGDVVFLHSVKQGPASQSYGIQVAKLAGVPGAVLRSARRRLETLEAPSSGPQGDLFAAPAPEPADPELSDLVDRLRDIDVDAQSPREALALLYELVDAARAIGGGGNSGDDR